MPPPVGLVGRCAEQLRRHRAARRRCLARDILLAVGPLAPVVGAALEVRLERRRRGGGRSATGQSYLIVHRPSRPNTGTKDTIFPLKNYEISKTQNRVFNYERYTRHS